MEPTPQREPSSPELESIADSDLDLQENLFSQSDDTDSKSEIPPAPKQNWQGVRKIFGVVAIGVLVVGGYLATLGSPVPSGDERSYPNWTHVEQVNNKLVEDNSQSIVKKVSRTGVESFAAVFEVGSEDVDQSTTQKVTDALRSGDVAAAQLAVQEAQKIPDPIPVETKPAEEEKVKELDLTPVEPKISTGMQEQILQGDTAFFHIYLYDCCDEDGDVVEILIDGEVFARVPITHKGATLSVPVGKGTVLELHGVRDGGGGITVACRTSQGDFFTKSMPVNDTQLIGIVK